MQNSCAVVVVALLGTSVTLAQEWPKEQIPTPKILDPIKAHDAGVGVWWVGHNGWLIKSGTTLIGTDLVTDDPARLYRSPVSAEELAPLLDVSFVTHGHGDHFHRATSRVLAEKGKCVFVMPANCVEEARKVGIPEKRIRVAVPRKPFELGGVKVSPLRAIHGNPKSAVALYANLDDCGYRIEVGGKAFLQPGDSVLLEDHLGVARTDVLFVSPTEHNTLIDPSVQLINALEPDYILPQHRDTYRVTPRNRFWANGYPVEVRARLSRSLQERYHVLKPGEKVVIERPRNPGPAPGGGR